MESKPLTATPPFSGAKPVSIRIWHWATAFFFMCSVITVSINEYILDGRTQIQEVTKAALENGVTLEKDQTKAIIRTFREPIWTLHKYAGFGICILLLWRMIIEIRLNKSNRLFYKLKASFYRKQEIQGTVFEQKHYTVVLAGYLIFYLLILLMGATGLVLAFEDVPLFKSIHDAAKETHELLQFVFYGYAVLHIAGTIVADATRYNGMVSRMIHGKE